MATFEVNTLVDEADYGAEINIGTAFFPIVVPIGPAIFLREAIALANATEEEDTITFAAGLSGTIKLTQGAEIAIISDLRIEGENRITVSGDADKNDTLLLAQAFPAG